MPAEPPPLQEAARCDVCKCSIIADVVAGQCAMNTLQIKWLYYSLVFTPLREFVPTVLIILLELKICGFYFGDSAGTDNHQTSPDGMNPVTDTFSRLDIGADVDEKMETVAEHHPVSGVVECKYGMPLCICEAPASAPPTDACPLLMKNASSSIAQSNPKPKKTDCFKK